MSPIKKRKADGSLHKIEATPSKRVKHTTSTHSKSTEPELGKESSPQPSSKPSPSPALESTSEVEIEPNGHATKSFQDLGIIQSLCDACTALGYKVHISS